MDKRFAPNPYMEKSMCQADWLINNEGFKGNTPHFCSESGVNLWNVSAVIDSSKVWINHYATRSKQEWLSKLLRGRPHSSDWGHIPLKEHLKDPFSSTVDIDAVLAIYGICDRGDPRTKGCCVNFLLGDGGLGMDGLPLLVQKELLTECTNQTNPKSAICIMIIESISLDDALKSRQDVSLCESILLIEARNRAKLSRRLSSASKIAASMAFGTELNVDRHRVPRFRPEEVEGFDKVQVPRGKHKKSKFDMSKPADFGNIPIETSLLAGPVPAASRAKCMFWKVT